MFGLKVIKSNIMTMKDLKGQVGCRFHNFKKAEMLVLGITNWPFLPDPSLFKINASKKFHKHFWINIRFFKKQEIAILYVYKLQLTTPCLFDEKICD